MKKLVKQFFYTPKYGKISDKFMTVRLVASVLIVIGCLAAMSLSAYAFFTYNITSDSNVIKAATFEIDVSLQIRDANGREIKTITSDRKSYWADLKADETYFITLKHTQKSTAETGFVIITAESCKDKYHTQQLGRDGDGVTEIITFKLKANSDIKVKLYSHWGTSSYYDVYQDKGDNEILYITNGETVELKIADASGQKDKNENTPPTTKPADATDPTEESTAPTQQETTSTQETTAATQPVEETTVPEETIQETTEQTTPAQTDDAGAAIDETIKTQ